MVEPNFTLFRMGPFLLCLGLAVGVYPSVGHAQQDQGSLRSDWAFTLGGLADSNPFRLVDGQGDQLDASVPEYLNMEAPYDLGVLVGIEAEFRTRRNEGRRSRFGFAIDADVFARNTARTNVSLEGFFAYEFSKEDDLRLKIGFEPSAFRGNYVVDFDAVDGATFSSGELTETTVDLSYTRELFDGKRSGLDLTLGGTHSRRTASDMPWRNRSESGIEGDLDAKLSKTLDLEIGAQWSRARHDRVPEPYDGQIVALNRDFSVLSYGAELGLDLSKSVKLYAEYDRKHRTFVAALGEDPKYGGRVDLRDTFGGRLRFEASRRVDVWLGGNYRVQERLRPAQGKNTYELDYRRARAFLVLEYTR